MGKVLLLMVASTIVGCSNINPRELVGEQQPKEELALIWFTVAGLAMVNDNELPINSMLGDYGDRVYIQPGETHIVAVRHGLIQSYGNVTVHNPDGFYRMRFKAEKNHTYLLDYKGAECDAVICLHDAGEGLDIPSRPFLYDKEYSEMIEAARNSKIIVPKAEE